MPCDRVAGSWWGQTPAARGAPWTDSRVDQNGDLFVAVDGGSKAHRAVPRCWGVLAFGPRADGPVGPSNAIPLPFSQFAIAVGQRGELYASGFFSKAVFVISDPMHATRPSGGFPNPYPRSLAAGDGIYVFDNAVGSARVYEMRSEPTLHVLFLQEAQSLTPSIAVFGAAVYTVESLEHRILLYAKEGNGIVPPILQVPTIENVTSLAIGR